MEVKGYVHQFGDHVDTDVIIPARYLNTCIPEELAKHCMEDIDANFLQKIKPNDIIVAGENFGCGSSREHAPMAIKAAGISVVIAKSFARIFYRNAINIGLPIITCANADEIQEGDEVNINFVTGLVEDKTTGKSYKVQSFPPFIRKIIECGGLVNYSNESM